MVSYLRHYKERPWYVSIKTYAFILSITFHHVDFSFHLNLFSAVVVNLLPCCKNVEMIFDVLWRSFAWALYGSSSALASYGSRHDLGKAAQNQLRSRLESAHTCKTLRENPVTVSFSRATIFAATHFRYLGLFLRTTLGDNLSINWQWID